MKGAVFTILAAAASLLLAISVGLVFLWAPTEARMGVVQKIFYFHVPSAYCMYLGWAACAVGSIVYLAKRDERWDAIARSGAEIALLFAIMVMVTGPLWGRKAWGAYWAWDPRLTSTLLFTAIVVAYALLRALSSGEAERRFGAALAILGACVVPIIHISVRKWRGQHPTVITEGGGGLADDMKPVFALSMIAFTVLFAALLAGRYALERGRRRLAELEERAAALGLAGERER